MIRYGVKIGRRDATVHVGEFTPSIPGAPYGNIGSTWFGCSADIYVNESDARAEAEKRVRDAVVVHEVRLDAAKERLARLEAEGVRIKRHS